MRFLKHALRSKLRQSRRELEPKQQQIFAEKITEKALQSVFFQSAKRIAFYLSFDGEVPTQPLLMKSLVLGKNCYAPVLAGTALSFMPIKEASALQQNRYGIFEPTRTSDEITHTSLDLVFVPVVAFDENCDRLGMGGGFYDRTFTHSNKARHTTLIGLAYELQRIDKIPKNTFDISLDGVITEKRLYLPPTHL